ncbi:MAG: HIT family protein [Flavobacteriales bacterium]
MATIFSKIVSGETSSFKVHESNEFLAFLDIMPLKKGHVLVIPKEQTDYIFDLTDSDLSAMILFAKEVAQKIKVVFPCKRIGMAVIGLEVPHAHIHLVPINNLADINFSNVKLELTSEELFEIATSISSVHLD